MTYCVWPCERWELFSLCPIGSWGNHRSNSWHARSLIIPGQRIWNSSLVSFMVNRLAHIQGKWALPFWHIVDGLFRIWCRPSSWSLNWGCWGYRLTFLEGERGFSCHCVTSFVQSLRGFSVFYKHFFIRGVQLSVVSLVATGWILVSELPVWKGGVKGMRERAKILIRLMLKLRW